MNNLGSAGSSTDLQETSVISFPVNTHYLVFLSEAQCIKKNICNFVRSIVCMVLTSTCFPEIPGHVCQLRADILDIVEHPQWYKVFGFQPLNSTLFPVS